MTGPASLAGFELMSLAGYAPRFVRGPALGSWGKLPGDVKIVFSGAVLSGLRKAAAGEKVALLLDRAQTAALPTLPLGPATGGGDELSAPARLRALRGR